MRLFLFSAITLLSFSEMSFAKKADVSYDLAPVITGLRRPVDYVTAPDGKVYILEQAGKIRLAVDNKLQAEPVLDLATGDVNNRVYSAANETGLLGLALHPNFATNRLLYINYTAKPNGKLETRVSELKLGDDGKINRGTERIVLRFDQPYENHNGGDLEFGPDGYLYIPTGDGGSANDPKNNGQKLDTFLGKMLRIDINKKDQGKEYAIPTDNPFKSNSAAFPEIYAYGLRNPWRVAFDQENGDLWAGDVGQNLYEEIDIIVKGGNYGWRIREAAHCFNPNPCPTEGMVDPIVEYPRNLGQSVTGGVVYYGNIAELKGRYIYADYVTGNIWAIEYDRRAKKLISNKLILESSAAPSSFAVAANGDLIVVDHNGAITKLVKR